MIRVGLDVKGHDTVGSVPNGIVEVVDDPLRVPSRGAGRPPALHGRVRHLDVRPSAKSRIRKTPFVKHKGGPPEIAGVGGNLVCRKQRLQVRNGQEKLRSIYYEGDVTFAEIHIHGGRASQCYLDVRKRVAGFLDIGRADEIV